VPALLLHTAAKINLCDDCVVSEHYPKSGFSGKSANTLKSLKSKDKILTKVIDAYAGRTNSDERQFVDDCEAVRTEVQKAIIDKVRAALEGGGRRLGWPPQVYIQPSLFCACAQEEEQAQEAAGSGRVAKKPKVAPIARGGGGSSSKAAGSSMQLSDAAMAMGTLMQYHMDTHEKTRQDIRTVMQARRCTAQRLRAVYWFGGTETLFSPTFPLPLPRSSSRTATSRAPTP
jgi:hypothetical protein